MARKEGGPGSGSGYMWGQVLDQWLLKGQKGDALTPGHSSSGLETFLSLEGHCWHLVHGSKTDHKILQCTGRPTPPRTIRPQTSTVLRARNPAQDLSTHNKSHSKMGKLRRKETDAPNLPQAAVARGRRGSSRPQGLWSVPCPAPPLGRCHLVSQHLPLWAAGLQRRLQQT